MGCFLISTRKETDIRLKTNRRTRLTLKASSNLLSLSLTKKNNALNLSVALICPYSDYTDKWLGRGVWFGESIW